jgi:hypothetical protein
MSLPEHGHIAPWSSGGSGASPPNRLLSLFAKGMNRRVGKLVRDPVSDAVRVITLCEDSFVAVKADQTRVTVTPSLMSTVYVESPTMAEVVTAPAMPPAEADGFETSES